MGRKLRLLLVDDRPTLELETEHLQIMQVPYGADASDPSLGTWAQHLKLWSDNLFPREEPDLVLIDCRFEEDHKYVPINEALLGRDPRGLLHGAIFLARMFGRDRYYPFGFAVYSMDASGFQNDAYAQTFMGFLLAMRDATLPEGQSGFVRGQKERDLVQRCAQELGRTIRQNPATAWGPALEMYRQRLKEAADLQAVVIDRETWLKAMDALQKNRPPDELAWRRSDATLDRVDLRSLFADKLDKDAWSEAAAQHARAWLESLLVLGDYVQDAVQWVKQVLDEGQDPESLEVPRGQDLHGQRLTRFFHACTGVIAWYENRRASDTPRLTSSNLLLELGLSDQQINRYFKPLLGLPWGRVVDLLDDGMKSGVWPFPDQWELHRVARDWAAGVRGHQFPLQGPR